MSFAQAIERKSDRTGVQHESPRATSSLRSQPSYPTSLLETSPSRLALLALRGVYVRSYISVCHARSSGLCAVQATKEGGIGIERCPANPHRRWIVARHVRCDNRRRPSLKHYGEQPPLSA